MQTHIAARPALNTSSLMGDIWRTFQSNARSIVPLGLVMLMPTSVAGAFVQTLDPLDPMFLVAYGIQLATMLVTYPLVLTVCALMAARGDGQVTGLDELIPQSLGRLGGVMKTFLSQVLGFAALVFAIVLACVPLVVGASMDSGALTVIGGILALGAIIAGIIGMLVMHVRWVVSLPMACHGHASGFQALSNSSAMTVGNRMRIFIVMMIVGGVSAIAALLFTFVPALAVGVMTGLDPTAVVPLWLTVVLGAGTLCANTIGWFVFGLFVAHTYAHLQRAEVPAA